MSALRNESATLIFAKDKTLIFRLIVDCDKFLFHHWWPALKKGLICLILFMNQHHTIRLSHDLDSVNVCAQSVWFEKNVDVVTACRTSR